MADKKLAVVAELIGRETISLWCDGTQEEVERIEGVTFALPCPASKPTPGHYLVFLDPRYDAHQLRAEIIERFSPEIPEAFKEERDGGE